MYVEIILVLARFANVLTVVSSATPAVSERKWSLVLGTLSLSFDNSQEAKNLGVGRCSCGGDLWSSEEVRIHRSENCHQPARNRPTLGAAAFASKGPSRRIERIHSSVHSSEWFCNMPSNPIDVELQRTRNSKEAACTTCNQVDHSNTYLVIKVCPQSVPQTLALSADVNLCGPFFIQHA